MTPCSESDGKEWRGHVLLYAPLLVTLCCYLPFYGSWGTLTLLLLAVLTLSAARLLQEIWLSRTDHSGSSNGADLPTRWPPEGAARVCCVCVGLLLMLLVLEADKAGVAAGPSTWTLLVEYWPLLLLTVGLDAAVLEMGGTPPAALTAALQETQTLHSDGAAWAYYLGYLANIFGKQGSPIRLRMEEYMAREKLQDTSTTNMKSLFILLPMKYEAMLSDEDFSQNDESVSKERALNSPYETGGRSFGKSQVYTITSPDDTEYRVALELASPLRHAKNMVDDWDVDFTKEDYKDFALNFKSTLQRILGDVQLLNDQVQLVPIGDSRTLGKSLVKELRLTLGVPGRPEAEPSPIHEPRSLDALIARRQRLAEDTEQRPRPMGHSL